MASFQVIIFLVAGIFITGLTLVMVFNQVWPVIRYGPISGCWGSFVSDFNSISSLRSRPHTVIVGDCVGGLVFANRKELRQSYRKLDCPTDSQGFVIAVPKVGEAETGGGILSWTGDVWNGVEAYWQELGGIQPLCKGLTKPFAVLPNPIEGPDSGNFPLCIHLIEGETHFTASILGGSCPEV